MSEFERPTPSKRFVQLAAVYADVHASGLSHQGIGAEATFSGSSLFPHIETIRDLLRRFDCGTVLDYGCGKASAYRGRDLILKSGRRIPDLKSFWEVADIALYDPGVPEISTLPAGRFDAVICTDVLEHCPEEDVDWILEEIFSKASKFVYANIAGYPAAKTLPNGENAHATIRPPQWWRERIEKASASSPAGYRISVDEKRERGRLGPVRLPFLKGLKRVSTVFERDPVLS